MEVTHIDAVGAQSGCDRLRHSGGIQRDSARDGIEGQATLRRQLIEV